MNAPFDAASDRYGDLVQGSISFAGQEHGYFVRRKADALLAVLRRHLGDPATLRVLDVGCGVGTTEACLHDAFGQLIACDPSIDSTVQADAALSQVDVTAADGAALPFADDALDVAFTVNVLHHVAPEHRDGVLAEMARVVRPGGLVIAFEHNPLNPLTRLSVARCEFDDDAVLLGARELRTRIRRAGLVDIERRYVIFTPFDSAWQHRVEDRLGRLPLGAQQYVAARVPADG